MQRLRQLEPSWLRSGQTTSLFASVIEKDDVSDDRGGIFAGGAPVEFDFNPRNPTARGRGGGASRRGNKQASKQASKAREG